MNELPKPVFSAGRNLAMKIPAGQYEATVRFYRDVLGLAQVADAEPDLVFEFGDKHLWLDRVEGLDKAEIWLEVHTDDLTLAKAYLEQLGVERRDGVEPLPAGFEGLWIANPAGVIHLLDTQ